MPGDDQGSGAPADDNAQAEASPEETSAASNRERIDQVILEAARKLEQTAEKLEQLGAQGTLTGEYSTKVASQLRSGARYLEGTKVESLSERAEATVRRNPVASLGLAFGVGFLVARLFRK